MIKTGQRLETIEQGNSLADLQHLYDNIGEINKELKPKDNLELYMGFGIGVPLLKETGDTINSTLQGFGVDKWETLDRYVLVDENNRTMRVRWKHGNPWTGIVIAVIVGLVLIALIIWQLNRAIPSLSEELPGIFRSALPIIAITTALLLIIPITRVPSEEERPP